MHSANSSTSHAPPSPAVSNPQHSHRFYHAQCQRPASTTPRTTPRMTPRLTREASNESTRQTAVSSFLQEKLQKERQAESEKSNSFSRANTDVNSSGEFGRTSHDSPTKGGEPDVRRPQSAAGGEAIKKKGMGVKDMEQVISSLHKQNFDLKLELYHRRERQTALEEQVEGLESEKARMEDMNDHLVQEMEKRDKAVEEAVAMIVVLEAQLEQFAQERAMVQQIEAEGQYSTPSFDPCYEDPIPKTTSPDSARLEPGAKVITRMPSFLSERSENTENLRNVYLGARGSVLSLPQVPEGGGDPEHGPTALASPSLSVLSESSFVSIYGRKGHEPSVPLDVDEPLSLDGADGLPEKASSISRPKTSLAKASAPSNRPARSNSLSTSRRGQFDSINNVIDLGSPLQKIERLERTYSQKRTEERPQSRDNDGASLFSGRAAKSPNPRRTREEKRESLRKVVTDAPGGVRLHDHALPPTPDTISTSTLRRFQNSNDTLSKQSGMRRSHSALSDEIDNDEKAETPSGVLLEQPLRAIKASARIIDLNNRAYRENRGRSIQRPRSADETTVSNRRGNDWDTDTDDSDAESLESSLDIWMRESSKPNKNGGRVSPDLFSFPSSAAKGGWAMDAMFGPGNAYSGGASAGIDPERVLDLFPVQQELFSTSGPPPTPNRRSSLNAQTGANSKAAFLNRPLAQGKVSKPGRRNRQRRNSDDIQMRAEMQTPVQPLQPPPPTGEQKKNHYPPISGQQAVRNGLTKLFRRSLGGGSSNSAPPPTPASDTTAVESSGEPPNTNGAMGVPSWMSRTGAAEDDRESATPPPIMRVPRHGRQISVDLSMVDDSVFSQEPGTPGTPMTGPSARDPGTPEQPASSPRVASASAPRRKWLPGFGRSAGLKNKTG
ncbi:hypothetical protein ACJ41O_006877 [Fusarium nematophilum]